MWTEMVESRQRMDERLREAAQWRLAEAARAARRREPAWGHRARVRRSLGRVLVRAGSRLQGMPAPRHSLHA